MACGFEVILEQVIMCEHLILNISFSTLSQFQDPKWFSNFSCIIEMLGTYTTASQYVLAFSTNDHLVQMQHLNTCQGNPE